MRVHWRFTMTRKWSFLGVLMGCFLVAPAPAAAAPGSSDVSSYVSDQFERATSRLVAQLAVSGLETACPDGDALCKRVVERLGTAVTAAVTKDRAALTGALDDFFVESSVAAGLEVALRPLVRAKDGDPSARRSEAETKARDVWLRGLAPVVDCVAGRLAGTTRSETCSLGEKAADTIYLLKYAKDHEGLGEQDIDALKLAWQDLYGDHRLPPEIALRVLAALATADSVQRPELRVYFLALSEWAREGLSDGLFTPTYAYLANLSGQVTEFTGMTDIVAGTLRQNGFWNPDKDATTRSELAKCPTTVAAFDAWTRSRDAGLGETWRAAVLRGSAVESSAFDPMLRAQDCSDPTAQKTLAKLKRAMRYQRGALDVYAVVTQYGPALLAGAAVLDYVRTRDDAELSRELRAMLLYAGARGTLFALNRVPPPTPKFTSVHAVLLSCEFQDLAKKLGVPQARDPNAASSCVHLQDEAPAGGHGADPHGAHAATDAHGGGHHAATASSEADDVAAALAVLDDAIATPASSPPSSEEPLGPETASFRSALRHLRQGDTAAANRAVLRLGVDLLVEQVDRLSTSTFGVSDESCTRDARSRSIFKGLDAACAAHVLIQSAYHPIADYFWDQGAKQDDPSKVAQGVYRNLLATPHLDTTPIILNVGAGANLIWGAKSEWGDGTTQLTLVDKIGVAFYKHTGESLRWETGPFVGGFLDALVRTATGDGKARRYWLAGYTVGTTRTFSTDFGLELHAAAALPFTSNNHARIGFAGGLALVVPFNFIFEED
ncbi:MAG TPA: hypothetical protein VMI54_29435 [Polyangiaceae bacterium]|nr:hypothetical protein [Polyangiaceae bacterium]